MSTTTNPRPLKERQRAEREELILSAAAELLAEKGYHEMSMEDVAARVGIAKGTVYLHFPSKDEMLFALITRDMGNFLTTVDGVLAEQGTPTAKLDALMRHMILAIFGARFQALHAIAQNAELRDRFIAHKVQFAAQRRELEERLAVIFEEGKERGEIDPTLATPLLVNLFESLLSGFLYQKLILDRSLSPEELATQVTRFFFKGIAAAAPPEGKD